MENENTAPAEIDNPNAEHAEEDIDIDELSNQVQTAFDAWDEKIQSMFLVF
ncbi:hypothetical protein TVAG_452570 [Trichomonas vaginalis G3]|uniref:Uncharacterized protein n=1 Tax=Trichomonas vaginalis (strain ATCC PRA-98 / G3) TaxID=412133 RepID=A2DJX9_TRIV3|nr:hypothetical protein TVAGG3_0290750 [Trichomonas vaginalis G3]EAY19343.1 hypothetical protein TVAG_452570 [Trichomonas vaginalis G3]KAI5527250.1 hypothetical protein TVAGG3_0290750 [Trichomonas vaginalis G3]|eukprot:XP_001580329.1 hypothetical protein [Trichomonas vaginalis G3]